MTEKEVKNTIKNSWINENIFKKNKADGAAYFILYVIIPIAITSITLATLANDNLSIVYCYLTIFISAANSIYDAANRWASNTKCLQNTKLFIIIFCNAVICVYCFCFILYILISKNVSKRWDGILLTYIVGALVSTIDTFVCFADNMAFKKYV